MANPSDNHPLQTRLVEMWRELLSQAEPMPMLDGMVSLFPPNEPVFQEVAEERLPSEKTRRLLEAISGIGSTAIVRMVQALHNSGQIWLAERFAAGLEQYIDIQRTYTPCRMFPVIQMELRAARRAFEFLAGELKFNHRVGTTLFFVHFDILSCTSFVLLCCTNSGIGFR